MSKLQEIKELSRLVPRSPTVERRYVTVAVRPLRLAFVINVNSSPDELIRYLTYNASIWGGVCNCLIPTDGRSLRNDWWAILQRYDPDKVVFCGERTPELMKEVADRIQPFAVWEWSDNIDMDHHTGHDPMGSVPMLYVLAHIRAEKGPIAQSRIRLPVTSENSPFSIYAVAQRGNVTDRLSKAYIELLGAQSVDEQAADLQSYFAMLSEHRDFVSPLQMTRQGLSSRSETGAGLPGSQIVLCSDNSVEDICLFWDLRQALSMMSKGKILVPADPLRRKKNLQALADWCNENATGTNYLTLVSATVGKARLVRLRDRLKPLLAERFKVVNVWYDCFCTEQFRAYEKERREQIELEDRTILLRKPFPSFEEYIRSGMEWVVDMDFQERGQPEKGFIPPTYPELTHLLSGRPSDSTLRIGQGYWVRIAQEQLACRVGHSPGFLQARVPDEEELFTSLLRSHGYGTRLTDTNRYAKGIIGLLGDYREARLFQNSGIRGLLDEMRNGHGYTIPEMKHYLRPGKSGHQEVADLIANLALRGFLLRGYNIRCAACDLRRWYPLRDFGEEMTCAGCLASLQPSVEAPFHYRLNELMIRGIEEGAIPVLLTILALSALAEKSFMFLPSVEVEKLTQKTEIDLLASCDGYLALAECKDLREGCSEETGRQILEQLRGIVQVAQSIKARLVFLSILADAIPDSLQQRIARFQQQTKDVIIKTLLKPDLERGFIAKCAADKETPIGLEDLFYRPRARERGWIREPGQIFVSF